jgi:general secretion pathway protein B
VSFILDALRKSEHERQRSTVPGLSHVPYATPARALPRWALAVMTLLAASLVALTAAWWLSSRPAPVMGATPPPPPAARPVELPPPTAPAVPPASLAAHVPSRALADAANAPATDPAPAAAAGTTPAPSAPAAEPERAAAPPAREPTLPSAAALLAEGISVPTLRLELHAYSDRPSDRFVFINGRKYVEGERLAEGPELVSIDPTGVVLSLQGQRFLLTPQ